jgi:ABC-2 type transport system permease protein
MFGEQVLNNPMPITLGLGSMVEVNAVNTFDVMAPGLLAFAVMFLTMTIAQSIVNERQKGLLKRLDTTPLSASEFISGQTIANATVAGLQVTIVLIIAFLTGYRPNTGIDGILLAILLSIIFSITAISFGLIVASIAKNDGSATLLSFVFILPQMMLGSFIPIPGNIGKFVPSYYITDAVTSIFLRGAPIFSPAIIEDLLILSAFAVGTFLIGMLLYKKSNKK